MQLQGVLRAKTEVYNHTSDRARLFARIHRGNLQVEDSWCYHWTSLPPSILLLTDKMSSACVKSTMHLSVMSHAHRCYDARWPIGALSPGHAVIWFHTQRTGSEVLSCSPIIQLKKTHWINLTTEVCVHQRQHITDLYNTLHTHIHTHMHRAILGKFRTSWVSNQSVGPHLRHTHTHTHLTPWVHQCEPSTFRLKPTLLYSPTVGTVSHAGLDSSTSPLCPRLHKCLFECVF